MSLTSGSRKNSLYILHQEIGLLERGEVAAPVEPVIADQVEPRLRVRLAGFGRSPRGTPRPPSGTVTYSPVGPKRSVRCDSQ